MWLRFWGRLGRIKIQVVSRVLGSKPLGIIVDSANGLFAVDIEDQVVGRELAQGGYSLPELERLRGLTTPDSRVLVVGGHIGTLAIPLAKVAKSVSVVEANPTTFRLLKINCQLNNSTNVDVHQIAASNDNRPLEFLSSRANSGGSKRVPRIADFMYTYDHPQTITVPAARMDDVFPDACFDLITMDIEGSEYHALLGMPELLRAARHLVIEFIPHHLENVAGVSVAEFFEAIALGKFETVYIPTRGRAYAWELALEVLEDMYSARTVDYSIIFSKG